MRIKVEVLEIGMCNIRINPVHYDNRLLPFYDIYKRQSRKEKQ